MFIIIVFRLVNDRLLELLFSFVSAVLLSILTPLLSSSVSLPYFILAVPMGECLGKVSCLNSTFPTTKLNGTCFFPKCRMCIRSEII